MISYEIPSHVSGDTWYGIPCITILRGGSALDLSGVYVNLQARLSIDSPIVLELTTENGAIQLVSPTSAGNITIPPQIIDIPVGTYKYDLRLTFPDNTVKTEMCGIWKILPKICI